MADTRTTLVGRERQVRESQRLVDAVAGGNGHVLVLSGDAGAGKTTLAEEAVLLARARGIEIGWASCWRSAAAPLSVWTDLVADAGVDSASMPAAAGSDTDPEGARAAWVRAVARHVLDALHARPTLLVVDDLQWADPLSLHAVEALAGLLRSRAVGLLCTIRDEGTGASGRIAYLAGRGRHVMVPPLTETELATLATELTGRQLTPSALSRLHDRTAGNVLFARELLAQDGYLTAPLDERRPSRSATVAIFAERAASLSSRCQQVLHAASVIGRRFRLDILAETLGADVYDLLGLIDEARAVGLLRGPGIGGFEFSHPLVAEACYEASGLPRRIRLHRDVAEAMERLRSRGIAIPAVEVAHHFVNAAAAGVADKAADYAALAARDDMDLLAYEDAVRDFGLALRARELCEADDGVLAGLLLDLADAHAASGDRHAARESYERAARLARRHQWPDVLARAALGVGSGPGGFESPPFDDHQIALLEEAACTTDGPLRSLVLARLSVARALDARATAQRTALSTEAIALARDAGDPAALGYALASWCDVIAGPDSVADRLAAADEILDCAVTARDIRLELLGRRLRIVGLLEAGRIGEFDAEVAAFASSAERIGQPVYSWYVPLWHATRASMEGRFDAAERLRAAAASIGATAESENARMLVASQRALLQCELRESEHAIEFFEQLLEQFPGYAIMALPALAYARAARGDAHGAREVIARFDITQYTIEALGSEFLTTVVMAAHAAWLAECTEHADTLYDALLPYRSSFAVDGIAGYLVGSIERTLGVLAAQRGDRDVAGAHFEAALEAHRRVRAPLLVAGTLRDAGSCLDDEGMIAEAARAFAAIGHHIPAGPHADPNGALVEERYAFRHEGDVWRVAWDGQVAHVRHSKGMADLATLLAKPRTEAHVLDLIDAGAVLVAGSTGEALDSTARHRYRARLEEIEHDLEEADDHGDEVRSAQLHAERDALIGELAAAYGLGGRTRRRGDTSERARSAVTQRIRDAITRIERVQPQLGRHLHHSIRTGTYCVYEPETPVEWKVSRRSPVRRTP
jgi:tetratricopeptide (TPR) repeat protein